MQIDNVDDLTTAPLTPNSPIIDNNQSPDGFASSFSSGSSDTISGEYSIELFIWRILFGFLIVFWRASSAWSEKQKSSSDRRSNCICQQATQSLINKCTPLLNNRAFVKWLFLLSVFFFAFTEWTMKQTVRCALSCLSLNSFNGSKIRIAIQHWVGCVCSTNLIPFSVIFLLNFCLFVCHMLMHGVDELRIGTQSTLCVWLTMRPNWYFIDRQIMRSVEAVDICGLLYANGLHVSVDWRLHIVRLLIWWLDHFGHHTCDRRSLPIIIDYARAASVGLNWFTPNWDWGSLVCWLNISHIFD